MLAFIELPVILGIVIQGLVLKTKNLGSRLIDIDKVGWNVLFDYLGQGNRDYRIADIKKELFNLTARPILGLPLR